MNDSKTLLEYKSIQGKVFKIPSLDEVPYDLLYKAGVRRLLFDFDGTIGRSLSVKPYPEALKLLVKLKKKFEIVIFSNNIVVKKARTEYFSKFGIEYHKSNKPFALKKDFIKQKKSVLIGDKFLTDGIFAKRVKIPCFILDNYKLFFLKNW